MISIIVVGFNSKRYLDDCFSSIYNSSYNDFEVIFVDNKSQDNSVEYVKKNFPKVKIIDNKNNSGFAEGNNIGVKMAKEIGSEYVFLLNPDTIIKEDCINILMKNANKNTILQPLILLHKDGKKTKLINTTGNYLNFLGYSYCNNFNSHQDEVKETEIPTASGAGALLPIDAFYNAGKFDKSFFMYCEDVDLFWRMRLLGYNIKIIPDAIMWHKYSFSRNQNKIYNFEKNRLTFIFKNFQTRTLLLIFPALLINELIVFIWSIATGWSILKIQSWWNILISAPTLRKKRLFIKKNRIIRDKDLVRFIGSDINYEGANMPILRHYSFILKIYWIIIKGII